MIIHGTVSGFPTQERPGFAGGTGGNGDPEGAAMKRLSKQHCKLRVVPRVRPGLSSPHLLLVCAGAERARARARPPARPELSNPCSQPEQVVAKPEGYRLTLGHD